MIKGKNFLITGGAGFIGSHTANKIFEMGGKVLVVDNLSTGRSSNLNKGVDLTKLDIKSNKLTRIFNTFKPDYVYHFAFNTSVPKSVEFPQIESESITGSLNVLENSKLSKVKKIIFASSGFIYGNSNSIPTSEDGLLDPVTPYAIAKKTIEDFIIFYNKAYNLKFVIFRYGTVYGPKQIGGAMTDYIRNICSNKQSEMWNPENKTRDYVYIDDIVSANILALKIKENYENPIFNLGTCTETSLSSVYEMISKNLNKFIRPIIHTDRKGELLRNCLNSKRFNQVTGWQAKTNISEGLTRRVNAYLANEQ